MVINLKKLQQAFHRLRGRYIEFDLKGYQKLLNRIDKVEHTFKASGDGALKDMSQNLLTRARSGTRLEELLVEAFALVREAARQDVRVVATYLVAREVETHDVRPRARGLQRPRGLVLAVHARELDYG